MGRRKRATLDDEDPDSSADSEEEEDLDDFVNRKFARKRQRRIGDEDDYEDDEPEVRRRADWTRAPAFVSGEKVDLDQSLELGEAGLDEEEQEDEPADGENEYSSNSEEGDKEDDGDGEDLDAEDDDVEDEPPPRIRDDEDEDRPRGFGIGAASSSAFNQFTSATSGPSNPQFARAGIGAKAGIGTSALPTAFGSVSEPRRSNNAFTTSQSQTSSFQQSVQISAEDKAVLARYEGSIGAKLMAKMGYQVGAGLGKSGEGIVRPIESKLRPKNAGIAFDGFDERTEQSKIEIKRKARREGKVVSDDEAPVKGKRKSRTKAGEHTQKRSDAWRKPAKRRVKTEYMDYEQIVQEAGMHTAPLQEKIIDATGSELREVNSLADLPTASWTPSTDPMRIPEVRHNLKLICESCKTDLTGLAREAKSVVDRRNYVREESARLRKQIEEEASLIVRLQKVHLVADQINERVKTVAASYDATLEDFSDLFEVLTNQYAPEFEMYHLDEVVVAAMTSTMKKVVMQWSPLTEPERMTSTLMRWRTALKAPVIQTDTQIDIHGERFVQKPAAIAPVMSPYGSLLWHVWLPKVRSAINNDWDPSDAAPAVRLFEAWVTLLPDFIRDNVLDQLIVPKIHAAISEWHPRKSTSSLREIVFPWLPHFGLRMESVMEDAKRKVKGLFRSWSPSDGLAKELLSWKEVFDNQEWENLILKYIVPKLAAALRDDFRINPAEEQDMEPFNWVMAWSSVVRKSVFSQILETEFFPKWLDILHQWLSLPNAKLDEIADWYSEWKKEFPRKVLELDGVQRGFMLGQQLMYDAVSLEPSARPTLPRPDFRSLMKNGGQLPSKSGAKDSPHKPKLRASRTQEITFKMLVEERAAEHNLLFMPTGRVHDKTQVPLYRVSGGVGGKGGIEVFIMDDAVWLIEGEKYRAISMDDMVLRATKGKV